MEDFTKKGKRRLVLPQRKYSFRSEKDMRAYSYARILRVQKKRQSEKKLLYFFCKNKVIIFLSLKRMKTLIGKVVYI